MKDSYIKEMVLSGDTASLTEEEKARIEFLHFTEEEADTLLKLINNMRKTEVKKSIDRESEQDLDPKIRIERELERGTSIFEIITSMNEQIPSDIKTIALIVLDVCARSTVSSDCIGEILKLIDSLKKEGNSNNNVALKIESKYGISQETILGLMEFTPSAMKKGIGWIVFWVLVLIASLLGLIVAIFVADDTHSVRSVSVIAICGYISWWVGRKIKTIYLKMKG